MRSLAVDIGEAAPRFLVLRFESGDDLGMKTDDAGASQPRPGLTAYLDQFVYVRLARAGLENGTPEDAALRQRLLAAVAADQLSCPLSSVHYLETWRQADALRRRRLAAEMMRFSRLLTMSPARQLWCQEIEHALRLIFGKPPQVAAVQPWGQGVAHAFAVEKQAQDDGDLSGEVWREFSILAGMGESRFEEEERERHEAAEQFSQHQSAAAARLAAWKTDKTDRRSRFRVQALSDFQADIIPALIGADVTSEEFAAIGAEGLERLVEAIPTIWTLTELRRVRFQNPAQGFGAHDLNDLRALCAAIVYCDLVVTDKAWCDAIGRTDLGRRFETVVLNDVSLVEQIL